jgi:hypothetical protein
MSRFVRLHLHGGEPILVNGDHVTNALAHDPSGSVIVLVGSEGDVGGEFHPVFVVVNEPFAEVERVLTGSPLNVSVLNRERALSSEYAVPLGLAYDTSGDGPGHD